MFICFDFLVPPVAGPFCDPLLHPAMTKTTCKGCLLAKIDLCKHQILVWVLFLFIICKVFEFIKSCQERILDRTVRSFDLILESKIYKDGCW